MQKITITIVLAMLCLAPCCHAQEESPPKQFYIDDPLPDITFSKLLFYKDSAAKLSDFKGKLVLFDFWFTGCSVCIEKMPEMDSIQKHFQNQVQVIMVTKDSKEKVLPVIKRWENQYHLPWTIPLIVSDTLLHQYFPHRAEPNYVWYAPENRFVAQTSSFFITREIIENYLKGLDDEIIRSGYLPDSIYRN